MDTRHFFLGFGGSHKAPYPLLVTAIVAAVIAIAIVSFLGAQTLFSITFAVAIIAVFEITKYLAADNRRETITVDTAIGEWFAYVIAFYAAKAYDIPYAIWSAAIAATAGFLFFRLKRPATITWIERNIKGGLGIVLASTMAGFGGGVAAALAMKLITLI